jgi:hypothetical protein
VGAGCAGGGAARQVEEAAEGAAQSEGFYCKGSQTEGQDKSGCQKDNVAQAESVILRRARKSAHLRGDDSAVAAQAT